MFKQLFSVFNQTRLTSAVSLTHHKSVFKTCVIFMIGRNKAVCRTVSHSESEEFASSRHRHVVQVYASRVSH